MIKNIAVVPTSAPSTSPGLVPPAGPQGASAYDIAIAKGYVGTVTQWLASLQGPPPDSRALDNATATAASAAVSATASAGAASVSATDAALSRANAIAAAASVPTAITAAVAPIAASLTAATAASATAAAGSATAAAGSATTAQGSATSATTQASAASTSASAASGSAAASTSAGAAAGNATLAQNWAMQASGTVDGTSYSAKYYALQAAASAQQAAAGGIAATGIFAVGDLLVASNTAATVAKSRGRPGFVVVDSPTSPYTSINRDEVWWSTAAGAVTQLLPAAPAAGMRVRAMRSGSGTVTVAQNSNTIAGVAADLVIDRDMHGVELIWDAALSTWLVLLLQHA